MEDLASAELNEPIDALLQRCDCLHKEQKYTEAFQVALQGVDSRRGLGDDGSLARALSALAEQQISIYRYRDALHSAEESVHLLRPFGPTVHLADSLRLVSICHARLFDRKRAVSACREGYFLLRSANQSWRAEAAILLPKALEQLSACLSEQHEYGESLVAAGDALALRQERHSVDTEDLDALARAYIWVALRMIQMRRPSSALQPAEKALSIRRQLYKQDKRCQQSKLAYELYVSSKALVDLKSHAEALATAEEAFQKASAGAESDCTKACAMLGLTLCHRGTCLSRLSRHKEAFSAFQEGLDYYRQASKVDAQQERPLATFTSMLPPLLQAMKRPEDSVIVADEAVRLCAAIQERTSQQEGGLLATSLVIRAGALTKTGQHKEALADTERAVLLLRSLSAGEAEIYRDRMAACLLLHGVLLHTLGWTWKHDHRPAATLALQEALELARCLYKDMPDAQYRDLLRQTLSVYVLQCVTLFHFREAWRLQREKRRLGPTS